jgi:putative ABC transport system permease protein
MDSIWQEMRLAVRRLARAPGFCAVVVLTLALGIGVNSALFSVVNSLLFSPLPFEAPGQLVIVWETRTQQEGSLSTVSLGNFSDWQRLNTVFQSMAAVQRRPYNVGGAGDPIRVNGVQASAGTLSLFGVAPQLGRGLRPEDERPGAAPVCLISHGLWLSRFGGAEDILAQQLVLDGVSHAVVGVLPPGFEIPSGGISGMDAQHVIAPLLVDPSAPNYRDNHNSLVFARLRDGATLAQANREIAGVAARLEEAYPEWNDGVGAQVQSLHEQMVQGVRTSLLMLFAAVGLVLLLARASGREREMTVRAALGAGRTRLAGHVLSEALVLSLGGGLLGLALCVYAVDALRAWQPDWLPTQFALSVDLRVLAFTFAISIVAGIAFGLLPAWSAARARASEALQPGARSVASRRETRARRAFVATQVAVAMVLLIGAGLLLRSFERLTAVEPGFALDDRIALHISLPPPRYSDRERVSTFLEQLIRETEAIPGVHSAAASIGLPLEQMIWRKQLTREEAPAATLAQVPAVDLMIVTPGYDKTLAVLLVSGRPIQPTDVEGSPFVALVNETFVEAHYPDGEPLGRRIRLGPPDHLLSAQDVAQPWYTIVGVLGDVRRRGPATAVQPEVYIPQRQDMDVAREFYLVVHASSSRADLVAELRQAVWRIDPQQPVSWVRSLDALMAGSLLQARVNTLLVGGFGLTAIVLALMGIYGLVTQSISLRGREFGVRLALGAHAAQIRRQVTGEALTVSAIGLVVGLGVALAVTRLMENLLFGVTPTDPLAFGAVAVALCCVVLAAAYLPTKRLTKLDPADALRWE